MHPPYAACVVATNWTGPLGSMGCVGSCTVRAGACLVHVHKYRQQAACLHASCSSDCAAPLELCSG